MKLDKKYSYATMMIKDQKVVIDELGAAQATFDPAENEKLFNEMKARTASKPRFILFNFQILMPSRGKIQKIAYIFWMDDDKTIEEKFLYASTSAVVKEAFRTDPIVDFICPYFFPFDYSNPSGGSDKKKRTSVLPLKGALH
ncbi:hypothetical protein OS493_000051 [Desmophyllum pertusum]|uniref:ADF-H domain-containing protein n=1 Tax=Desmophyllum pertusum TaxID=174260 RepID=A0A9X0A7J3_9CNID|nr:hypothetical protein OS493_000051 [Desmophyllum pertusum]